MLKSVLIPTPSPPVHVALSCDSITLSVCLQESGILKCYFYDTRGLGVQVTKNIAQLLDQLDLISHLLQGASLNPFSAITLSETNGKMIHFMKQQS